MCSSGITFLCIGRNILCFNIIVENYSTPFSVISFCVHCCSITNSVSCRQLRVILIDFFQPCGNQFCLQLQFISTLLYSTCVLLWLFLWIHWTLSWFPHIRSIISYHKRKIFFISVWAVITFFWTFFSVTNIIFLSSLFTHSRFMVI